MRALVSNIQRFSLDDGPGIRTTIFLKGCNLRCAWCHNPECISSAVSLQYREELCVSCRHCQNVCPNHVHHFDEAGMHRIDRSRCNGCGKCTNTCPGCALTVNGKYYQSEELFQVIQKDEPYYSKSNGGVTFSGGEPMLQIDFLEDMLKRCRDKGIHTAVDTAGNVAFNEFERILKYTDVFLFDVKSFREDVHMRATGVSNERILKNLTTLSERNAEIIVRVPIIEEYNANLEEIVPIADFLSKLKKIQLIQLLPYHNYGAGKYATLGIPYRIKNVSPPSEDFMEKALNLFLARNLNAQIS